MDLIRKYFHDLDAHQSWQFEALLNHVPLINQELNIISRKDVEHLEERHILHSLAIAKKIHFNAGEKIVDAGTGGGFPGIPLAIFFPETQFILVDSIGKKTRAVEQLISVLKLKNARVILGRIEKLKTKSDYIVSRAVTSLPRLYSWTKHLWESGSGEGGLISLKGGNLDEELKSFGNRVDLSPVSDWFEEPFFSTKMIVFLKK